MKSNSSADTASSNNSHDAAANTNPGYELLDSGDGEKLERFGELILRRPSKFSIWKRRLPNQVWDGADGNYHHSNGWIFRGKKSFETWRMSLEGINLELRLQQNGQIGVFPEHVSYAKQIEVALKNYAAPKVLNLFAYTGLATIICAKAGAQVTHLDISKSANRWAEINLGLNHVPQGSVKLITEDVAPYLRRLANKGEKFEMIIADPPSFSRPSKNTQWQLEEYLPQLLGDISKIITPSATIFLTSHLYELGAEVMANLCVDTLGDKVKIQTTNLTIHEAASPRNLPAGFLVQIQT